MSETKVIGYFAYKSRTELYCDGEALIIAGSHSSMKRMLTIAGVTNAELYTIRKARCGEILSGIDRGGAYAFDQESYGRYRAAVKDYRGVSYADFDFTPDSPEDIKLVTISIK